MDTHNSHTGEPHMHTEARFAGGPADGRIHPIPTQRDGQPASWLVVPFQPWRSALDPPRLVPPEEMHCYELSRNPSGPGAVRGVVYEHRGPLAR